RSREARPAMYAGDHLVSGCNQVGDGAAVSMHVLEEPVITESTDLIVLVGRADEDALFQGQQNNGLRKAMRLVPHVHDHQLSRMTHPQDGVSNLCEQMRVRLGEIEDPRNVYYPDLRNYGYLPECRDQP